LIGEGKKETNFLKIDYVKDGYDLDTVNFPPKRNDLHIFDIDQHVSKEAAKSIRTDAPDLSWVYLWFTDDAGHSSGNGKFFDEYVLKADQQIGRIWEAVKFREANYDEEWMVIVTTDHGRGENGYGHGGQSVRERTIWISINIPVNDYFKQCEPGITDIAPSICRFMGFEIPRNIRWEQDGIPFIGEVDIAHMKTMPYDNTVCLSWESFSDKQPVTVYAATTNKASEGGKDQWIKIATVNAGQKKYVVDLSGLPNSKFYKFVLETPHNHLNRWLQK